jgi:tetratricopeptide (TPR) repeat protein
MIVSTTLTTALDCVPPPMGAGVPIVGMSPANAVTDRTHVKATIVRNRFIEVSPLGIKRCKVFYIGRNRTTTQDSLQGSGSQLNIRLALFRSLTSLRFLVSMRTASPKPKLDLSHLPPNARALARCQKALELKDRGDYDAAQEVMRPLWKQIGERPNVAGLEPSVVAEVLFSVGTLTGWIGSRNENGEANDTAKDLLTESITAYEVLGDLRKVAEVQIELAVCYWRAGGLDESRIMLSEALGRLASSNGRAYALVCLSVVEWSSSRYDESLKILTDNASLFKAVTSQTLKGTYHNQLAMVLRTAATERNKVDHLRRALKEYEAADFQFKDARNPVLRAHVKNNIGNVLRELSRFRESHEYLDQARRLTVYVHDRVRTAQIDETRAQVFIAQRRYAEAEVAARSAAASFEKVGRQCFLAEALITQGIASARLGKNERARFAFQRAIEVAHQAGALNIAGLAALSLIEEVNDLPTEVLSAAYEQAKEWLESCQSEKILLRLKAAKKKATSTLRRERKSEVTADVLYNKSRDLTGEVSRFEHELIRTTLAQVDGSITSAAKLLGVSYQRLGYVIESRHKDLLKERKPIRRRAGKGKGQRDS